jgi:hypothetical protein
VTLNQQFVQKTLKPLQGLTFISREAIEDAFYPYYGPLQPIFQGEGHRDLVDRLIAAKWITIDLATGHYSVTLSGGLYPPKGSGLNPSKTPEPEETLLSGARHNYNNRDQSSTEINYSELQTILEIGSAPNGMALVSSYSMNEAVMNSLLQKELVQLTEDLADGDRLFNDAAIKTAVVRAKDAIDDARFQEAIGALETAAKYAEKNKYAQAVYVLTPKGQVVREKVGTVMIKI